MNIEAQKRNVSTGKTEGVLNRFFSWNFMKQMHGKVIFIILHIKIISDRTCYTFLCERVPPQCISSLTAGKATNCFVLLCPLQVRDSSKCGVKKKVHLLCVCRSQLPN